MTEAVLRDLAAAVAQVQSLNRVDTIRTPVTEEDLYYDEQGSPHPETATYEGI